MSSPLDMIDVVAGTQFFSLAYEKKQGVRALSPHLATSFGNGKYSSFPKTTVMYMVPVFPMKKKWTCSRQDIVEHMLTGPWVIPISKLAHTHIIFRSVVR